MKLSTRRKLSKALMGRKRPDISGERSGLWNGGRYKDSRGYMIVYCPNHPHAYDKRYVLEHRLVMEKIVGRYLLPTETVHHKNHKRDDNRPSNLELILGGNSEHMKNHQPWKLRKNILNKLPSGV